MSMSVLEVLFYLILSYLLGAIPFGLLTGKLMGKDIRRSGSGNIGATNTFRTAGPVAGIITLLLDALKGALPVLLFPALLVYDGVSPENLAVMVGVSAFIGHVWPVFLRFRGGKGVATALGVLLALAPYAVLTAALLSVIIILLTRIVSLGSLMGIIIFLVSYTFFYSDPWIFAGAFFISLVIIIRHRGNIQRLMKGTENRL